MNSPKINTKSFSLLLGVVLLVCSVNRSYAQDLRPEDFKNPEKQYRPKTWMHAMSGNMSKEGITKDFESMQKAGLIGLLLFNITQGIPFTTAPFYRKNSLLESSGLLGPVVIVPSVNVVLKKYNVFQSN